jgi:NADH-quinone oxidoreductase subunit E
VSAPQLDPDPDALAASVRRYSHGSRVPGWDDAVDLDKDPAAIPDPATTPVPDDLRAHIEALMARYPDRRSAAIPGLAAAQRLHGYCSPEAIDQVACVMRLTPGYLVAVATFYDMFYTEPKGAHDVYVCTNISCSLRGGDELYDAMLEAAEDRADLHVQEFECLGACDLAPMASVDGIYVGPLEIDDARRLVDDLEAGRPVLEEKQLRYRRVADPEANREEWEVDSHPPASPAPRAATPVMDPEAAAAGPAMEGVDAPDEGAGPDPIAPREQEEAGEEQARPEDYDEHPAPSAGPDAPASPPKEDRA